ncbi:MAG: DUF58 domain-containing protein [Dehalococcoidia bacterium]
MAVLATAASTGGRASSDLSPDTAGLPPEVVAQIRRIEIRARRLASTLLAGDYRSVFRGSGIEFAEAREYTPGDDVRRIDWNVTARMGTPWVKEYVEERELSVVCAVDVSASQSAARPTSGRLGLAAELVALLGFTAAYNSDRSGLLTFSAGPQRFVPPARGTTHVLRLVREVLNHPEAPAGTDLASTCDHLARVLQRRSAIFLITDGFVTGFESTLRTLARRHEVIALTLIDAHDLELPDLGIVELEDAESGLRVLLDSSNAEVRRRYARAAEERAVARRASFASAGVEEVELIIGEDYVQPLLRFFRRRAARR